MKKQITIRCTDPQKEFHKLKCKYAAFCAGYGAGKSHTLINQALIDASMGGDALIAIYEPSYDLIRLIMAPRLLAKLEEEGIEYEYNKTEQFIKTKSNQFGNFILRSLDTPERIVGYESFRAHIDEIDVLNKPQAEIAWLKILGRNRQVLKRNPTAINRVSAYSTPEGYNFMYDTWVKNTNPEYQLIKASSRSNPFLPKDYLKSLEATYKPEQVAAYIEGEFVNLTTGTIYSDFNRITCNSEEEIISEEDRKEVLYIGMDFNVGKMASTVYVRRNNGREWHACAEFCNLLDTPEMIRKIKEKYPGHKVVAYPDASGKSRDSTDANKSDLALLEQAGFEIRVRKNNPYVKERILAVNTAFFHKRLFVNVKNCPVTTECLEQQPYNDKGEPDKKNGKDHQNDATGYPIAFEMPVKKPVFQIPVTYPQTQG